MLAFLLSDWRSESPLFSLSRAFLSCAELLSLSSDDAEFASFSSVLSAFEDLSQREKTERKKVKKEKD